MANEIQDAEIVHAAPSAAQSRDMMVSMIERVVMDPNANIEKLERMLVIKRELDREDARRAFSRDLSQARAKIPPIKKDARVDYKARNSDHRTQYNHETLSGIALVIDPILAQFGLSYRFKTDQPEGTHFVRVTCIIAHRDGYEESTSLQGIPDTSGSKNSYQATGSAVTYLQRYTLKAALGLSAAEDDDAQAVTQSQEDEREKRRSDDQRQTRREAEREAARVSEESVQQAVDALHNAETMDQLVAIYTGFDGKYRTIKDVVDAKNKRKAELEKPAPIYDDEIPF